tara:strand:- start:50 stop:502 length:453 start_codon:yes stop_codon:yes gene_type:complete
MKMEEDFESADREPESKETPRDYMGFLVIPCCLLMIPLAFMAWGILGAQWVVVGSCLGWWGYRHIRNSEAIESAITSVLFYLMMVGVLIFGHLYALSKLSPMIGAGWAAVICVLSFLFLVANMTGSLVSHLRRGRRLVEIDDRYADPLED